MIMSCSFTSAVSGSVTVTQIMKHNVILLTYFALVYLLTSFLQLWSLELELSLLILVCIHESYIVYFEIAVVPIGHGFSCYYHGKVMENQCWKWEHPVQCFKFVT